MRHIPGEYTQPTPSSETDLCFDSPIMRFFSMKSPDPSTNDPEKPPAERSTDQAEIGKPASVTIADDTVPDLQPPSSKDQSDSPRPVSGPSNKTAPATAMAAPPSPKSGPAVSSDSGYTSAASPHPPPPTDDRPRSPTTPSSMKSIPVVWTGEGPPPSEREREHKGQARPRSQSPWHGETNPSDHEEEESGVKRTVSLGSLRGRNTSRDRDPDSVRTRSREGDRGTIGRGRRSRVGLGMGSFAAGAGTVGPASTAHLDESILRRSASAAASLNKKQKAKIVKGEVKEGKQVAKVVKKEAKAEKEALQFAIKEMADIQRIQKTAIKEEAKAHATQARALRDFHKEELEFLAARAKFDRAQTELQAHEDAREAAREHAREVTEMLQEKNKEVEWLRAQKAADDREREAKLKTLVGKA